MLTWETIIRSSRIWSEGFYRGDLIATVFASDDEYASDIIHALTWSTMFKVTFEGLERGLDAIERARLHVEREHALTASAQPDRVVRTRSKAKPIDYSQFDGYAPQSAHSFSGFDVTPRSQVGNDQLFDSILEACGGS